jgi:recombinational DNA repair protein (RecF pathway)
MADRFVSELTWAAWRLQVPAAQLAAERQRERRQPFPELYAELREHCMLADWEIAKRLGVTDRALLRRLDRHGIKPSPELRAMCAPRRDKAAQCA